MFKTNFFTYSSTGGKNGSKDYYLGDLISCANHPYAILRDVFDDLDNAYYFIKIYRKNGQWLYKEIKTPQYPEHVKSIDFDKIKDPGGFNEICKRVRDEFNLPHPFPANLSEDIICDVRDIIANKEKIISDNLKEDLEQLVTRKLMDRVRQEYGYIFDYIEEHLDDEVVEVKTPSSSSLDHNFIKDPIAEEIKRDILAEQAAAALAAYRNGELYSPDFSQYRFAGQRIRNIQTHLSWENQTYTIELENGSVINLSEDQMHLIERIVQKGFLESVFGI